MTEALELVYGACKLIIIEGKTLDVTKTLREAFPHHVASPPLHPSECRDGEADPSLHRVSAGMTRSRGTNIDQCYGNWIAKWRAGK